MQLEDELFEIEREFWYGGEDAFLAHLDERCLLAFPQSGEMHGIFPKTQIAETATMPNRWHNLEITNQHLLTPTDSTAVISYRADVLRADGIPYAALVTSLYVKRADGWKLAAHQHGPVNQPLPAGH